MVREGWQRVGVGRVWAFVKKAWAVLLRVTVRHPRHTPAESSRTHTDHRGGGGGFGFGRG